MPYNVKHNKFQVSKFGAKLYTKSTGIKVDKHKIIGHDTTKKNSSIQSNKFNDYYKAITVADQKQSICMGSVEKLPTTTSNNQESIKKVRKICHPYTKFLKSTFGKPSLDHTFTSEASFEHILIFVLKGRFLLESDKENLLNTHPLIKHFNKMLYT